MSLRVLVLEDVPEDAEMVVHALRQGGYEAQCAFVASEADFVADLSPELDVILADYHLPQFTALQALQLLKSTSLDIPFIVVTGNIGEEEAVECVREGAADYLLKDRLARLPTAVARALEAKSARQARSRAEEALRLSEERYRQISELTSDYCYSCRVHSDGKRHYEWMSGALERITGYTAEEFAARGGMTGLVHPDSRADLLRSNDFTLAGREHVQDLRIVTKSGEARWLRMYWRPQWDEPRNKVTGFIAAAQDITERMLAEERVQRHVQRLTSLHSIGSAINSSLDLHVTLATLLDQVISQLHVDAADILMCKADGHVLELAAQRGLANVPPQHGRSADATQLARRAALERRTIAIPDLRELRQGEAPATFGDTFIAYFAVPLVAKGVVKGVLELFQRSSINPDAEWLSFLDTLAADAAIALHSAALFEDVERSNDELVLAYDATIAGWSRAMDLRDRETEGHSQRVADLTLRLAASGLASDSDLVHIRRGALLHDLGKIGVPDSILHKPGPLTEDEWKVMKQHPQLARDLLWPIPFLRRALDIPECHHEKWDGSGYPHGLAGEKIPLAARIFAIADVWDALRSDRPYRAAWTPEKALDYIRQQSGVHLDPRVVDAFWRLTGTMV